MSRPLDVWGGNVVCNVIADAVNPDHPWQRQVRVIVAAPSGAAARRALAAAGLGDIPRTEWNAMWGTTGNDLEVEVALADPGRVFGRSMEHVRSAAEFVRLADDATLGRVRLDPPEDSSL